MRLPSKKFLIILAITVVIGTGLFFVLGAFNDKTVFNQEIASPPADISQEKNTSVFKNLTDEKSGLFIPSAEQSQNKDGNLTETLSKELLTALILKGNTDVSGEEIKNTLALLFEKSSSAETPRIYSRKNVRVLENTEPFLRTYGNEFMDIVAKHSGANAARTLNAFERTLETRDEKEIKTLWSTAEEYRKMESDMLSVPVPEAIASAHLDFINILRAIQNAVTDMGFVLTDPVRGTLGFTAYVQQLNRAWEILNNVHNTFDAAGVFFTQKESGYAWKNFNTYAQ